MRNDRSGPAVVAILNTNDDIVEMLRTSFERAGLVCVSLHLDDARRGTVSLNQFVEEHDPRVVLFDLAPPYEQYWRFLQHLKTQPYMEGRHFVVTSTNVSRAAELAGRDEAIYEIIGKPYDIDQLTTVVREAARARPTR